MKPERWYCLNPENPENEFLVFDTPTLDKATSVSIIKKSDIQYYRTTFTLKLQHEHDNLPL